LIGFKNTETLILIVVFWVATPCGLVVTVRSRHPEDGSHTFLRNVGNNLQDHTASQPISPQWTSSPLCEPNSHTKIVSSTFSLHTGLLSIYLEQRFPCERHLCSYACIWYTLFALLGLRTQSGGTVHNTGSYRIPQQRTKFHVNPLYIRCGHNDANSVQFVHFM
jgi:hypothetical protein